MHEILRSYLKRLTNLSGNNRSLLLLRLVSDQTIDLHDFDFLLNKSSFSLIEDLLQRKKHIPLAASSDPRLEQNNLVSKRLKKLKRIEKFIYDESGAKDLYVGWPFVRGRLQGGTLVRCPLIFFPVRLEEKNGQWEMGLREEVNITFNKTFLLAYAYYHGVEVSDELIEKVFEIYDKDSRIFRTELYQTFKESTVSINFNQDNFIDKLSTFENFKKADFEEREKEGELKLYPEAVLGIFPQSGSYLVPDYTYLLEQENNFQDIEEFFLSRRADQSEAVGDSVRNAFRFIDAIKEEETFTAFKMDAYQENALKAVKMGNSLVVQGPPGTGKSQLISNLVSDFVARGKKVLVVSQKRAALDVIYERLKSIDLGAFAGLVHDFKNDRKKIYDQVSGQVNKLYEYELKNNSLDAIQIQRNFAQNSRRIDQLTEELEEYRSALFDNTECGYSVKELYLNSDPNEPHVNLKQVYRHFKQHNVDDIATKLKHYISYAKDFNSEHFSWNHRVNFSSFTQADKTAIQKLLKTIPEELEKTSKEAKTLVGSEMSLQEFEDVVARKDKLLEVEDLLTESSYHYLTHIIDYKNENTNQLWLSNIQRIINDCFKEGGIEQTLPPSELGVLQKALEENRQARKRPTQWVKWQLFSKDKYFLKKVTIANELPYNKDGLKKLARLLDNRLNFEHNITKLKSQSWLKDVPKSTNQQYINQWFEDQILAIKAKEIITSFTNFKVFFLFKEGDRHDVVHRIKQIIRLAETIIEQKEWWKKFISRNMIDLFEREGYSELHAKALDEHFDELVDFDQMQDDFLDHERQLIKVLEESDINFKHHDFVKVFRNSIYLAWIEHIETKHPVLRQVSTRKFDRQIEELQQAIKAKLALSQEILSIKVREKTYANVEYNRLNNRVTYRDLEHQVTKKRQIWPIRKLINEFSDELFDLIPCWMASPESVSAIFPMEEVFDLVIFDEASQCFVEKGIPAMYRGKQVLVAGDSKQLRPNDLYRVRWEEEDTKDIAALEIDSLLELSERYLMNVQLSGHYRSKALELIEFSNRHFYDGKLRLLPDFHWVNKGDPAIQYVKVNGVWEQNINENEARNVVDIIKEKLKNQPDKEIGVVTFNSPQQAFILDLLDEEVAKGRVTLPDAFFVKNIENVQGDEKDIIIFSTGYAPDKNGRMIMQFGSMNTAKGENRLNVAITRARERIIIVSSIYPDELRVEDTRNDGPKLLKAYLQYARQVSEGAFKPSPNSHESFSDHWYLKKRLIDDLMAENEELHIEEELPFADLTLKNTQQYLGLINTDDDLYYENPSVKDIYAYKPFMLSKMNWKNLGFNSRNYWLNKEEIYERFQNFIRKQQA